MHISMYLCLWQNNAMLMIWLKNPNVHTLNLLKGESTFSKSSSDVMKRGRGMSIIVRECS